MTKDKNDLYTVKFTLPELQYLRILLVGKAKNKENVMNIYKKLGGYLLK